MTKAASHCRLFVILAREAHRAVIFRSGLPLWMELILWDTDADTFTEGQWFKGGIYIQRCDLSPDGQKLIYRAAKHYKQYVPNTPMKKDWTAISRPPYYTALAMWDISDRHDGGGYFTENGVAHIVAEERKIQSANQRLPQGFEVKSVYSQLDSTKFSIGFPDRLYYDVVLPRRGWARISGDFSWNKSTSRFESSEVVWQKDNIDHTYNLRWIFPLTRTDNRHIYKLLRYEDNTEFTLENGEWADWDQRGRLVYTDAGKLFVGTIRSDGIEPVELADFNPNELKLFKSPAWAQTWDQTP